MSTTWNMGGTSWEAFEEWVDTLSQEEEWDLLLLQETFRNVDARHLQVPQGWDVLKFKHLGRRQGSASDCDQEEAIRIPCGQRLWGDVRGGNIWSHSTAHSLVLAFSKCGNERG